MAKREKYSFDVSTAAGQKRLMAEAVGGTYVADRRVDTTAPDDYGADPIGDGTFRMVPSGDIVDFAERCRRLKKYGP